MWCLACEDTQKKNEALKAKLEYISRDRDALKEEITKLILKVKELEEALEVSYGCCDSDELSKALNALPNTKPY